MMIALRAMLPTFNDDEFEQLIPLLNAFEPIAFAKGETIYTAGQPFTDGFVMMTGLLRSYYLYDDKEVNLRFLTDQSLVMPFAGFVEKLLGQINTLVSQETMHCIEDCSGYRFDLQAFFTYEPSIVLIKLINVLSGKHYLALEQRLRMIQHKRAIDRYTFFCDVMPEKIIHQMPSYHIASYLGVSPEALSRLKIKD